MPGPHWRKLLIKLYWLVRAFLGPSTNLSLDNEPPWLLSSTLRSSHLHRGMTFCSIYTKFQGLFPHFLFPGPTHIWGRWECCQIPLQSILRFPKFSHSPDLRSSEANPFSAGCKQDALRIPSPSCPWYSPLSLVISSISGLALNVKIAGRKDLRLLT